MDSINKIHVTKDGEHILLKDLSYDHLKNIIKYIKKRAKKGITIPIVGRNANQDIWYDEDFLEGREARKAMHYKKYKKELKRRQNNITNQF